MTGVSSARATLPILKLLVAALMLSWERRALLARVLWMPLLVGIGVSLAELRWGPKAPEDGSAVLWALPIFLLTVMLAVRSYRAYLVGADSEHQKRPLSWSLRETRFLLAMFGISTVFAVLAVTTGSIIGLLLPNAQQYGSGLALLLVLLPGAYLAGRLLLAFPAIAVEESSALRAFQKAWDLSRDNGLRIVVLCVAVPGSIAWLLARLGDAPAAEAVSTVLVWLLMPVELAIVAMVYATLSRPRSAGE